MKEHVVLLHGYGVHGFTMRHLEAGLKQSGFITHNWSYRTALNSFGQICHKMQMRLKSTFTCEDKVHFVGHSMGGLVIRGIVDERRSYSLGRIVMLGTPNNGSKIAERINNSKVICWLLMPICSLSVNSNLINTLAVPDTEIGIISGIKREAGYLGSLLTGHNLNDGLVELESTKIDNGSDYAVYDVGHLSMLFDDDIQRAVCDFLNSGNFPNTET